MNLLSNRRLYGMNRMDERDCRNDEWCDIWDASKNTRYRRESEILNYLKSLNELSFLLISSIVWVYKALLIANYFDI